MSSISSKSSTLSSLLHDHPQVIAAERDQAIRLADRAMKKSPVHITDTTPPELQCVSGDYYSNGEYWWPDPDQPDGLPFMRRDGYENPNSFKSHRRIMRQMIGAASALTAAYRLTEQADYATAALTWLHEFFVDPKTRMNPHMCYAQAVPGRATGRSFGLIDTRVLIETPRLVGILQTTPNASRETIDGIKNWFAEYLQWLRTHPHGRQESRNRNNHATCYTLQLSMYAALVGDTRCVSRCRRWFRRVLLPDQMADDGSFPKETGRTRPYSYSIFNLEQMVLLCQMLSEPCHSEPGSDLWSFELPDGRSIRRGLDFLYPYLDDKKTWPFGNDAENTDDRLPRRMAWMLMAAQATGDERWEKLWHRLPAVEDDHLLTDQHTCRYASLWL